MKLGAYMCNCVGTCIGSDVNVKLGTYMYAG